MSADCFGYFLARRGRDQGIRLKNARYLESLAGLNIYFGYGAGLGTSIAPAWLSKA